MEPHLVASRKIMNIIECCQDQFERSAKEEFSNSKIYGFRYLLNFLSSLMVLPSTLLRSEQLRLANLLRACSRNVLIEQGRQVHAAIVKEGFSFDRIVCNYLIDMYAKCRKMESACRVFDVMPQRNVVSWTALMCGFLNQGNSFQVLSLFCKMVHSDANPNEYTLSASFKACGVLGIVENGMQVHCVCLKTGYEYFSVVGNSVVDMYSKCGRIDAAAQAFDSMPIKNLITWNTMMAAYNGEESYKKSLMLFQGLQRIGEIPDEFTFTSLLKACGGNVAIREGTQIHAALITRGYPVSSEAVILGSLVDLYVKCGYICKAQTLFDQIENKNVTSWTSLILGYAQAGYLLESMELFQKLRKSGIPVDGFVISSLIGVFADLAFVEQGKQMHAYAIKVPSGLHTSVANSISDMYLKCGLVNEAERYFNEIPVKNRVSYTVMITGYGKHGLGEEAVCLFEQMLAEDIRPDGITYLAILSACSHSGLAKECQKYFSKLLNDRSVISKVEHYACMVDLLGRAGRFDEAKNLIKSMPHKPDVGIWQTLLSSCRVHGNLEMAKEVGKILLNLDGNNPVNYVMMSNIYANAGCWKEYEEVRGVAKQRGLKKNAGQSWVEIDKTVYFFYGGDDSHPLREKILEILREMEKRLKEELGFAHELSYALHDVEEESKEENLRVHSEKLAIGLALLHGGVEGDGKVITVFKNLRVCVDCHEFIKGLSAIVKKVFLVRDASRFHRFENGLCSCRDYW